MVEVLSFGGGGKALSELYFGISQRISANFVPGGGGGYTRLHNIVTTVTYAQVFDLLDIVRLRKSVEREGVRVQSGATGTIVHVHDKGAAFIVEFDDPEPCVVTLYHDEMAPKAS